MLLRQLLHGLERISLRGSTEADVLCICCDSRAVTAGALFVCLPGQHRDGADFALQAVAQGAVAVVCERPLRLPPEVAVIRVANARRAMAWLSVRLYGEPARRMTMIGITGTKGKTVTAHLAAATLTAAGRRVGLLGTNGACWSGHRHNLAHTPPESCDLQRLLYQLAQDGCDTCVMEVSSLGLKMERVTGIYFDIGIFTNLTPDHISPEEHASFAEYRAWKSVLFRRCATGIVNADDPHCEEILANHSCKVVRYGITHEADWRALPPFRLLRQPDALGVAFYAAAPDGTAREYTVHLPGRFSVYNALAALSMADVLHLPAGAAAAGLQTAAVRGRCEVLPLHAPYTVVLDYAHNAASAAGLLTTLRGYAPKRLVAVFGCGGQRSRLRRFGMGEVCAKLADLCILTEDNSRDEPLENILADIKAGLRKGNPDTPYREIPDRRAALYYALDHAQPGDMIAVLGKGHETFLERAGERLPFDEREIILNKAATNIAQ